jgi:hypothetical protein
VRKEAGWGGVGWGEKDSAFCKPKHAGRNFGSMYILLKRVKSVGLWRCPAYEVL